MTEYIYTWQFQYYSDQKRRFILLNIYDFEFLEKLMN